MFCCMMYYVMDADHVFLMKNNLKNMQINKLTHSTESAVKQNTPHLKSAQCLRKYTLSHHTTEINDVFQQIQETQ